MRLTASRAYTRATAVPKMPPGLVDLMEGLTKDVLKNNPTNVYEFCANHFEKLLNIRDGPSSKKSKTLEEKISIAQEKVRQRAKERQERLDNKLQKHEDPENEDFSKEQKLTEDVEPMPHLNAPVHHDQNLSPSSEVEISHEPITDNSLSSKDSNVDESDEIPISKSSTFSSVSKSTVIDLGNDLETNKEEIEDGIDKPKIDFDVTEEHLQENDQKEKNTQDENIEPTAHKTIDSTESNTDYNNQQEDKVEFTVISPDDGNATTEPDDKNASNEDNQNETSAPENSDGEHTVSLNSSDGVNFDEGENIAHRIEPSPQENDSTTNHIIENVMIHSKGPTINITDDDVTSGNPNGLLTIDAIKITETATEKATVPRDADVAGNIIADGSSLGDNDTKVLHFNEGSEQEDEETDHSAQIGAQEFRVNNAEDAEEIIRTPDLIKGINVSNETDRLNADITATENKELLENYGENNTTKSINNINLKYNEDDTLEVCKDDIDNTNSVSLTRPSSDENNDDTSVIGSDLSKADDDNPRSDNENVQNNMDLETAAVTIQKVFRSFLFKSRNSTFEDITHDEAASLEEDSDKKEEYYAAASAAANINKERRSLGITRMDTVLQTVNEEKSLSLSTDDSSTLSSAATTIQAHVRGFLVRNRLNSYKTVSTNSLVNSNEMLDTDTDQQKNKTVLNIHIVPEEGNYLSRDESLITSMDLSLDGSPPSSINLHPLSYDLVSERRKLLKREDAIQSVSPPSNNSGKLSEDSVKEVLVKSNEKVDHPENNSPETMINTVTATVHETSDEQDDIELAAERRERSMSSDESDVITPYVIASPRSLVGDFENNSKLLHSGEFHDVVLPTKVSRGDTTVVREFKNVLAYILLWNN